MKEISSTAQRLFGMTDETYEDLTLDFSSTLEA